jgi:uncharacterized protein (DUF2225 family)
MGAQSTLHCCYTKDLVPNGYYADCKLVKTFESNYNEKFEEIIMNKTKELILNSKAYQEMDDKDKDLIRYFN